MNPDLFTQIKKQTCIALTGGIASGKSAAAAYLQQQGFHVIDADQLSRTVLEPGSSGYKDLLAVFGQDILLVDGKVNRAALRKIVFDQPALREKLESIVHGRLDTALQREFERLNIQPKQIWFYEASLIMETGKSEQFREVWLIKSEPEIQRLRLRGSRNLNEGEIDAILARQWSFEKKAPFASHIFENHHSLSDLYRKLDVEISRLRQEGAHVPTPVRQS